MTRLLVRRTAEVLAASPDSIDPTVPLRFAGLDSLLATKLVKRLRDELDLHVRIDYLLGDHSLTDVAKQLADSAAPRKASAPSKARTAKTSVA